MTTNTCTSLNHYHTHAAQLRILQGQIVSVDHILLDQLLTFKQCNVSPFGNIWNLVSSPENQKGKNLTSEKHKIKRKGSSHPQAEYN